MRIDMMRQVARTNESRHIYEWVTSQRQMSHATHSNASGNESIRIKMMRQVAHTNESRHIYE